jgi:hypothetical protein
MNKKLNHIGTAAAKKVILFVYLSVVHSVTLCTALQTGVIDQ